MCQTKVFVAITITTVLVATYFGITLSNREEELASIVEINNQKGGPSDSSPSLTQTSESKLSTAIESASATSPIQTQSVTELQTSEAPNASSTSEPVPIPPQPSVPSNAGFVIALACGVCGVIALLVGTGVAGYCLLLSRRARDARARRELQTDSSSNRQDMPTTAEPTFGGSNASSDSRFASGMSSDFGPDQTTNGRGNGAGSNTWEGASGDTEYRAGAAAGAESIPMGERGGAIVGRKSRSGADGEGITLTVTKAESYV